MCGNQDWFMREVKDIYQVHDMVDICESCGNKADKFVDYYGVKNKSDKFKLKQYLNTGIEVQNKYNALIHAGYY